MRALISKDAEESLELFGSLRHTLPDEMRNRLFDLLKTYSSMKDQGILGIVPVLRPYERLHPLFYFLSDTEKIYYTVEDTLTEMKKYDARQDTINPIEYDIRTTRAEIDRLTTDAFVSGGDNRALIDPLRHRLNVLTNDIQKFTYSKGHKGEIEHAELKRLTRDQRRALTDNEDVGMFIRKSCDIYNSFTLTKVEWAEFREHGIEDKASALGHIFNFNMSIISSFKQVSAMETPNSNPRFSSIRPFDKIRIACRDNNAKLNSRSDDEARAARETLSELREAFSKQLGSISAEVVAHKDKKNQRIRPVSSDE
jgi:hypothetical protein